jgi:2-polyprenyl-6-methoxyphenol hydroxylase-like FAD-dependent oxidoreductase
VASADIQQWLDDYLAVEARIRSTRWTALFRIHSRIADHFRSGSAFLVGDSAHIHSPAGGQGMNLAIGEAFNLGWKLAVVATQQAREQLLDSHEAPRLCCEAATADSPLKPHHTRSRDGLGPTSRPASVDR